MTSQQPSLKPNEYCVSLSKVQRSHTIILTYKNFMLSFNLLIITDILLPRWVVCFKFNINHAYLSFYKDMQVFIFKLDNAFFGLAAVSVVHSIPLVQC